MPSHSVSCRATARLQLRTKHVWSLIAAAWTGLLLSTACRDTREDTNFCKNCTNEVADSSEGAGTSAQDSNAVSSAAEANMSQQTGVMTATNPGRPDQAGTASPSKGSSGSSASVAGTRASSSNSGTAVMFDAGPSSGGRGGLGGNSGAAEPGGQVGQGGRGTAANGGNTAPLDAGLSQTPTKPDAGHMEPLPCNGACPADRPVCDESGPNPVCRQCTREDSHACTGDTATCDLEAYRCVQCTVDDARNCGGDTPVCNRNNRCVRCTDDRPASCPAAQPICDGEKTCVECLPDKVDHCAADHKLCTSDGRCIQCVDNMHCPDIKAPRCDRQSNTCTGCESNNDCHDRFQATPYCDKASHTCVACTTDGDPTCGAGMYCDASNHTCVQGTPGKPNCTPCSNQADCAQSAEIAACLPVDNEQYCFEAAKGSNCPPGYKAQTVANHGSTQYCLPLSDSSCPAINSALMSRACKKNEDCGKNGLCSMPKNVCSLKCSSALECPQPMTCVDMLQTCVHN